MNILYEAKAILEEEYYKTMQSNIMEDQIYFEDESLLGFISTYDKLEVIIENWNDHQNRFLNLNANKLRNDPTKAWNIYSIYLTQDAGEIRLQEKIVEIEESFVGSRKIIGFGIQTKDDLVRTLLPLISIQKVLSIQTDDFNFNFKKVLNYPELLNEISVKELSKQLINK